MSTLYVTEPDARIEKEYHRILVTKNDEVLLRVPLRKVTDIVLVGRAGTTTPALHALLNAGVGLTLVSRSGKLLGKLSAATGANLPLRQQQYRRNDDETFTLALARQIVAGKIRNQRVLAQRLNRRKNAILAQPVLDELAAAIQSALEAQNMPSLLGIEGQAARRYFSIYRQAFDPEWSFTKRTRRPPKDPVNTLLSLGYTFLGHAMTSALEVVGLDPYLGFFHAEKYGCPALALDLLEEFRPLVDSLTLTLINRRTLQPDDFEPTSDGKGIYLTRNGMNIFVRKFSQKLETPIQVRELGRSLSYRKIFEVQARKLARVVQGKDEQYEPFKAR
jgi:CRISP-associated protein Cas1